jgi:uncharacterized protein
MILYMDTSALVKYYVKEHGSHEVSRLISEADIVGFSSITYVEMASALAKAIRMNWITSEDGKVAWQDFLGHWQTFTRLSINSSMIEQAGQLAWEYGLRGYDATHLAAALVWKEALELPVILATYDRELWSSARKVGLIVWPEEFGEKE